MLSEAATEKLRRVLDRIVTDPRSHDQGHYGIKTECGTALCVAGHLVDQEDDWEFIWQDAKVHLGNGMPTMIASGARIPGDPRGDMGVASAAHYVLGTVDGEWSSDMMLVDHMFRASNTLGQIFWYAGQLTGGAIQPPKGILATSPDSDCGCPVCLVATSVPQRNADAP